MTRKERRNRSNPEAGAETPENTGGGFADIVTVNKLTPESAEFFIMGGGFLGLKENGEDKGRVGVHRMTPITSPDRHLSIRNMEMKEIGIIFNLNDFSEAQREIIMSDIRLRYFTPEITDITELKEDYGYTFITAETSAGKREFTMRDLSHNIIFLTQISCFLTDTDGNRYFVADINKMSDKVMRVIGVWA